MPMLNWRKLCSRAGSFGLLSVVAGTVMAADCAPRTLHWQASQVSNRSDWNERDSAGRKLVQESGLLHGAELSADLHCPQWSFSAALSQLSGTRWYDGQTSTGVPAISTSEVHRSDGHLQVGFNLTPEWQLLGRLAQVALWRNTASIASASGFSERFDWTLLSVGTQWSSAFGPGQLSLSAWLGKPLSSRMRIDLPGRDPTALQPGSTLSTELSAGWRAPLVAPWHWQAELRYRRTDMNQGAPAFITRGGTQVGVAFQPATSMVDRAALISISRDF